MAKYAITGALASVAGSYKTVIDVFAGATPRRGKVYDVLIGTNGTPADNYLQWDISRMTADGTGGSSITPNPLDPADAAALATAKQGYTAEPTVTANSSLFNVGVNQRASYRWVAAPGSELVFPATANNGLALRTLSGGYTSSATGDFMYEEQ